MTLAVSSNLDLRIWTASSKDGRVALLSAGVTAYKPHHCEGWTQARPSCGHSLQSSSQVGSEIAVPWNIITCSRPRHGRRYCFQRANLFFQNENETRQKIRTPPKGSKIRDRVFPDIQPQCGRTKCREVSPSTRLDAGSIGCQTSVGWP